MQAAAVLAAVAAVFVAAAAQGKAGSPVEAEATGSLAQAEVGGPAHGQGRSLGHGKAVTSKQHEDPDPRTPGNDRDPWPMGRMPVAISGPGCRDRAGIRPARTCIRSTPVSTARA